MKDLQMHEKNEPYKDQKDLMYEKYAKNINSLNIYYKGMETFICFAVLCENARAFARGEMKEILPGGGTVNMNELIADVRQLDALAGVY